MALYHFHVNVIQRSQGRMATAAAAYRAGECIVDERTGIQHDYTRKSGVQSTALLLPGGSTEARAAFWNRIEHHHTRINAVVAREIEVSLPAELDDDQRYELAVTFARELADKYRVAIDVALHAPRTITDRDLDLNPEQFHMTDPKTGRRHNGNWHAHMLIAACHVESDGTLGKKCLNLDPIHCQRHKIPNVAERERGNWARMQNSALQRAYKADRVDHRSYADRDCDREPTAHLGGFAARMLREGTPQHSELAMLNREIMAANHKIARLREQARQERIEQSLKKRHQLQICCDLQDLEPALCRRWERIEKHEWEAWISLPGVCPASGRIVFESRMMDKLERSYHQSNAIEAAECDARGKSRVHCKAAEERARELRDIEWRTLTQPGQPSRYASRESPQSAFMRAELAVRRLLRLEAQCDRAAAIKDAMIDPDEAFANEFQELLVVNGIGAHGELSPTNQRGLEGGTQPDTEPSVPDFVRSMDR
ncbi:MobA/MobL family protein [Halomonas chromatireducens]|uniref:MobA/MobL family protein n=1 Tax=Halomonas chromatireducens TaxID=507626 RepID=A0A0X8HFC5_9GAMM|nr:MobA/MobL family protein [Halomonas chromatireducens]AMD01574.1 MobA/MobL family protein [Halomonas chromatireducens]